MENHDLIELSFKKQIVMNCVVFFYYISERILGKGKVVFFSIEVFFSREWKQTTYFCLLPKIFWKITYINVNKSIGHFLMDIYIYIYGKWGIKIYKDSVLVVVRTIYSNIKVLILLYVILTYRKGSVIVPSLLTNYVQSTRCVFFIISSCVSWPAESKSEVPFSSVGTGKYR